MQSSLSLCRPARISFKCGSEECKEATWPGMFAQVLTCINLPGRARRSLQRTATSEGMLTEGW